MYSIHRRQHKIMKEALEESEIFVRQSVVGGSSSMDGVARFAKMVPGAGFHLHPRCGELAHCSTF